MQKDQHVLEKEGASQSIYSCDKYLQHQQNLYHVLSS